LAAAAVELEHLKQLFLKPCPFTVTEIIFLLLRQRNEKADFFQNVGVINCTLKNLGNRNQ
jgi:hypothetical protein